jgi:hypothetical protein
MREGDFFSSIISPSLLGRDLGEAIYQNFSNIFVFKNTKVS